MGSRLHAYIIERDLLTHDVDLDNALINMYAKAGAFVKAHEILSDLPYRSVIAWNALISAYAQHGIGDQALDCFQRMQDEGLVPNECTFTNILKACGGIKAAEKGEEIYTEICRQGLLDKNILVGTALIDMYTKCGMLAKARGILHNLPQRDVTSWTALIAGYAEHGFVDQALEFVKCMQEEGLSPNAVTSTCLVKACSSAAAVEKGEEIYEQVKKMRLLENDLMLGTTFVHMFAKFGNLVKARVLFDGLPARDVTLWSVLIAGYAEHGHGDEAIECYQKMRDEGLSPDAFTFMWVLKAYTSIGAIEKGEEIYAEAKNQGSLQKDIMLGTSFLDMYGRCGNLARAQDVFNELPVQDIASWTALIAGYAQHGLGNEALNCFERMQEAGFSPNAATFTCILKACGSIGAAEKGEAVHHAVYGQGLLKKDVVLGTALVDMYAKLGALANAQEVFDEISTWNTASWS
ncbi:hypothetical protein KP509_10G012900 [Ceratopteris richardii]|nr:hypothetical protein KP509_10G012900 [Ceratopteris richardii]